MLGNGKGHTPEFGARSFPFQSSAVLKEAAQAWTNDAKAAEASAMPVHLREGMALDWWCGGGCECKRGC